MKHINGLKIKRNIKRININFTVYIHILLFYYFPVLNKQEKSMKLIEKICDIIIYTSVYLAVCAFFAYTVLSFMWF